MMNRPMNLLLTMGLAAMSALSQSALAAGVAIDPGQWNMTMTMDMPMLPEPQVRSYSECIKESELDPEKFKADANAACEVRDTKVDGNTVSWALECAGEMGSSRGEWSFTSTGDTMHGEGTMTTDMGEQSLVFTMRWDGERIGACE